MRKDGKCTIYLGEFLKEWGQQQADEQVRTKSNFVRYVLTMYKKNFERKATKNNA